MPKPKTLTEAIAAEQGRAELRRHEREIARLKNGFAEQKARAGALAQALVETERAYNLALGTESFQPRKWKPDIIRTKPDKKADSISGSATALCMLTDWHLDERVDAASVNGANRFNPAIAERRVERTARQMAKRIVTERAHSPICGLAVWLGGDFISGNIHEESADNATMGEGDAILFAEEMIGGALATLEKIPGMQHRRIFTSLGNHGRTTKQMRFQSSFKHSLEWIIYHHLAKLFTNWHWEINPSYYGYATVERSVVRYHHGHRVRGGGGVGGIAVPLLRAIGKGHQSRPFDIDISGHHHQDLAIERAEKSGSLIGYNAFAIESNCPREPPQQKLLVIDRDRGKVFSQPIFCE